MALGATSAFAFTHRTRRHRCQCWSVITAADGSSGLWTDSIMSAGSWPTRPALSWSRWITVWRRSTNSQFRDDCEAAYPWVLTHADNFGGNPAGVAVGGSSAGGNLAAAVCLRAREHNIRQPIFQLLVYPATDCNLERPSYLANGEGYGLMPAEVRWFWEQYVSEPEQMRHQIPSAPGTCSG